MKRTWITLMIALLGCMIVSCNGSKTMVTVPADTQLLVSLDSPLSTGYNEVGDKFESHSTEPLQVDGEIIIPAGTTVRGSIMELKKPGDGGNASMTLVFNQIVADDGNVYAFHAAPISLVGESDHDADVERVTATTIAGALIGGIAEGGKGALIGGVVGAGAGGTWAVLTKGDNIVLDKGLRFEIETAASTDIPLLAVR